MTKPIAKTPKPLTLADKAVRVISLFKNTKGDFQGQPFNLQPWQENEIIRPIFRTDAKGRRIIREAFIFLPRKNGKSELIAAIALFHLLFEGERGAEVILGASDKDQASIVYRACAEMVRQDPNLSARCKTLDATRTIVVHGSNSTLHAIPADEAGAHGLNPSLVIADELHAWPDRSLYDALRTGQGARSTPLFISITTAGYDKRSICFERYDYACGVRDGRIPDPAFLPVIYEAGPKDDWRQEKTWRKANPGLSGEKPFRNIDEMRRLAKEAEIITALQNTFRRLYLNQWTEQDVRWIDPEAWRMCDGAVEPLEGRPCFVGLDLANKTDTASAVFLFPAEDGYFDILARFYVPEEGARKRSKRDKVPYEQWIKEGHIIATPGDVIDYNYIRADINKLGAQFDIQGIGLDPWNAQQMMTDLQGDGFDAMPFRQGFASLSGPSKEFERLVIGRKYRHGGNPVLAWMAANVAAEIDAAENVKPSKKKSRERIDGIVALIMATGLTCLQKPKLPSVYETRGLLTL